MKNTWKYIRTHKVRTGIVVIVVLIGGWLLFFRGNGENYQTLTVHTSDFTDQVSVSGAVTASQNVDLGFSQSGRVSGVYANVGDKVGSGALLAQIENGDLRASVSQKKAALQREQAALAKLQAGTRPEQLQTDHDALLQAIGSAYIAVGDAVHTQVDQFVIDSRTSNPKLSFSVSDSNLQNKMLLERVAMENLLTSWQNNAPAESISDNDLLLMAGQVQARLMDVETFLDDSARLLNSAVISSSLTQSTLDSYKTNVGTGRTEVSTALSKLVSSKGDLTLDLAGSQSQDIDVQQASVSQAQADLDAAEAQLSKTLVVAPFSGTITKMDAKVGEIVGSNASEISMISNGTFQIETYVPEVSVARIKIGQLASTTLDAYGPTTFFAAKVISIDPAETVRNGISTYKTILQFTSQDSRIRSGMTASVNIITKNIPTTIAIPKGAVITRDSNSFVEVMQGEKPAEVPVVLGETSSGGLIQITAGLKDGDIIVLNP